ncbi:toll/interleukin-1 receptor domain-containing protein [Bradyrhizobium sp. Pear77]|uniref:toll/interleukin-1 receptor domain-containing protein n=1 Tax=Bradyrhizobium altum TaxID=1571202 RepID=UPI001E2893F2|nr:toll/interleukin-1 receptor domain-containing protein [Bradyrhizobium altum]MCC8955009.1 toll/interleukin-1 receptor domain-containing protein [Bradyrhizobium altum]
MRFVAGAQKQISTFISHSAENNDEAQYYETLLKNAGFSAFQYSHGLHFGDRMSVLRDKIRECSFFILVVSDYSMKSEWVQRELGLAVSLRRRNSGYRPIIIPLYAAGGRSWQREGRPTHFPTRHFDTGTLAEPFSLSDIRGLDKHASPIADSDDKLVSLMKPNVLVTRLDFNDAATFDDTGVFDLYEDIFPEIEQDDRDDIVRWVLRTDLGQKRSFVLSGKTELSYRLDSRYFILCLADRAIGLGFFTYDHSNKLIYGNYIAVQQCWRSGDIAHAFFDEIMKILEGLFPKYQGMVFEVERFQKAKLEKIVSGLEQSGSRLIEDRDDQNEIRKFLRVAWYYKLDCYCFFDRTIAEPLVCRSPSLDPSRNQDDWASDEEDYWIMWYQRPGSMLDHAKAKQLWVKALNSIYLEILAKSLSECHAENGQEYWNYAAAIVEKTLRESETKDIVFKKYLDRKDSPLLRRLTKLKLHLPI